MSIFSFGRYGGVPFRFQGKTYVVKAIHQLLAVWVMLAENNRLVLYCSCRLLASLRLEGVNVRLPESYIVRYKFDGVGSETLVFRSNTVEIVCEGKHNSKPNPDVNALHSWYLAIDFD
jgi:hypothetical protein